jgi:hypothetical protein
VKATKVAGIFGISYGADDGSRTHDLCFTKLRDETTDKPANTLESNEPIEITDEILAQVELYLVESLHNFLNDLATARYVYATHARLKIKNRGADTMPP